MLPVLDDFSSGFYSKTLQAGAPADTNFQHLSIPGPLGQWRDTFFQVSSGISNPWAQPCTLDIQKGILIITAGFQAPAGVQVLYGNTPAPPRSSNPQGPPAPLHLNLSKYSAFQFAFAGISTSESLNVTIELVGADNVPWAIENFKPPLPALGPSPNAVVANFPFANFTNNGVPLPTLGVPTSIISDIYFINFQVFPGGFATFGITSWGVI
jgi:hypothetical protein